MAAQISCFRNHDNTRHKATSEMKKKDATTRRHGDLRLQFCRASRLQGICMVDVYPFVFPQATQSTRCNSCSPVLSYLLAGQAAAGGRCDTPTTTTTFKSSAARPSQRTIWLGPGSLRVSVPVPDPPRQSVGRVAVESRSWLADALLSWV
jgi:hypothetical protein